MSDELASFSFDLDEIAKHVNESYAQARGEDLGGTLTPDTIATDDLQVGAQQGVGEGAVAQGAPSPTPPDPAVTIATTATAPTATFDEPIASGTMLPPESVADPDPQDGFVIAELAGGAAGPDGSSVGAPPAGTQTTAQTTASATAPAEPVFSLDEMARAAYGTLSPEQGAAMFDLYDRVASMPPHLQQAAIALISGDIDNAVSTLSPYSRVAPPAAPAPAPAPTRARDPLFDDDDDPTIPPEVQARIDALEAQQRELVAQQQAAYQQQIVQQATLGLQDFADKYGTILSPGEIAGLQHAVNQASTFVDAQARSRNGDYRTAYAAVMETHLFANPELRARVVSHSTPAVDERQRQQRAASVASNSGGATTGAATTTASLAGSPLAAMPGVAAATASLPKDRAPTQAELAAAAAAMIPQG